MKNLGILLIVALTCAAFGVSVPPPLVSSKRPAAAGGGGPERTENFEGTGYENGWAEISGNADPDQATTGLSLEASQCLYIDGNNQQEEASMSFTASDNVYLYMMFRFEDEPSATRRQWAFADSGGTMVCSMSAVNGPTTWRISEDTAFSANGANPPSVDTTYHVWFEREKGTGANEAVRFYFSTDGTKPGSPECAITDGTGTGQVARFVAGTWGTGGGNCYFDKIRISITSAFGSNPP